MSNTITIILSSIVLSSAISSLVSILISSKNSTLQYITNERKEWRDEIRKLTEELYKASSFNVGETLIKLKTRINSFGKRYKRFSYDAHIWGIIENLENSDQNNFMLCKNILIDYLLIMIKYDWERSKNEIRGNRKFIYKIILNIISISYFTFLCFYVWELPMTNYYIGCVAFLIVICSFSPNYSIISTFEDGKISPKIMTIIINYVVLAFLVLGFLCYFKPLYNIIENKDELLLSELYLLITLVGISIYNSFQEKYLKYKLDNEYENSIFNVLKSKN